MSKADVRQYETIIFLGGCSDPRSCARLDEKELEKLQVQDLVEFVHKMNPSQHLLTVSTGAILEGYKDAKETTIPINYDRLDSFAKSLHDRENALASLHSHEIPKITVLRLGSVVGVAPHQPKDLLIRTLFWEAYTRGTLELQKFNRLQSFLWLEDLGRAVEKVIHTSFDPYSFRGNIADGFSLWHLSSFHARDLKIATTIASITGAKLDVRGVVNQSSLWETIFGSEGYSLSSQAFRHVFNFSFEGTLDKVLLEFDSHVPRSIHTDGPVNFSSAKDLTRDDLFLRWIGAEVEKRILLGSNITFFLGMDETEKTKQNFLQIVKRLNVSNRLLFDFLFHQKYRQNSVFWLLFPFSKGINHGEISNYLPLTILVFSKKQVEEVALMLLGSNNTLDGIVHFIVVQPTPELVRLQAATGDQTVIKSLHYHPTPIPNPMRDNNRKKVKLYCHIRNENMMIPFYIIQHAHMFDSATFLDFLSDDETLKLIEEYAPNSWKIVNSTTGLVFDIVKTDRQLQDLEKNNSDSWAVVLNVPELLVHPSLRLELWRLNQDKPGMQILQLRRFTIVGDDKLPLEYFRSLPEQRHIFNEVFSNRYLHYGAKSTYAYKTGRHRLVLINGTKCVPKCFFPTYLGGFVMVYEWSPWPEIAARKLAVGNNFPKEDVDNRRGFHHTKRIKGGMKFLEEERGQQLLGSLHSLCDPDGDTRFLNYRNIFTTEFQNIC